MSSKMYILYHFCRKKVLTFKKTFIIINFGTFYKYPQLLWCFLHTPTFNSPVFTLGSTAGAWPQHMQFTLPVLLFTHYTPECVRVILSVTFMPDFVMFMIYWFSINGWRTVISFLKLNSTKKIKDFHYHPDSNKNTILTVHVLIFFLYGFFRSQNICFPDILTRDYFFSTKKNIF